MCWYLALITFGPDPIAQQTREQVGIPSGTGTLMRRGVPATAIIMRMLMSSSRRVKAPKARRRMVGMPIATDAIAAHFKCSSHL